MVCSAYCIQLLPLFLLWLPILPVESATYNCSLRIQTTSGPIIGRNLITDGEKHVDAFQGIPYAKPPVGELRFKKPIPPDPWTEPRETKTFGSSCLQKELPGHQKRHGNSSEDCLTLNVFTPTLRCSFGTKLPVIFFVHGGAFKSDSVVPYGDVNIGQNVVSKDVVVVTVEYRLGFLGFWSTGDSACPGNNALWDLTLALKWVKENIAKFGGDPDNVTVMGQSAGGALADYLSISPHSRDLFHKVVCMAGTASMDWALSYQTVETSRRMAEELGVTSFRDSEMFLSELRQIPAEKFKSSDSIDHDDQKETLLGPRFDADFFPKQIHDLVMEAPVKPRIIGQTRAEGIFFAVTGGTSVEKSSELDKVAAILFSERKYLEESKRLRDNYTARVLAEVEADNQHVQRSIVEAVGDKDITIGTQESAAVYSELGSTVFLYRFDYSRPEIYGSFGTLFPFQDATHTVDVGFFFGAPLYGSYQVTDDDRNVTEIWSTYITNFAKYGDPNGPFSSRTEKWLPMNVHNPERNLQISRVPQMSEQFFNGRPLWVVEQKKQTFRGNNCGNIIKKGFVLLLISYFVGF